MLLFFNYVTKFSLASEMRMYLGHVYCQSVIVFASLSFAEIKYFALKLEVKSPPFSGKVYCAIIEYYCN